MPEPAGKTLPCPLGMFTISPRFSVLGYLPFRSQAHDGPASVSCERSHEPHTLLDRGSYSHGCLWGLGLGDVFQEESGPRERVLPEPRGWENSGKFRRPRVAPASTCSGGWRWTGHLPEGRRCPQALRGGRPVWLAPGLWTAASRPAPPRGPLPPV